MTGHTLFTTVAKVLDVLGYRRMLRIEWSIVRTTRGLAPRPGVRTGFVDVEEFASLGHPTSVAEAVRRGEVGERIMGLWYEGELVGAFFVTKGRAFVPYLDLELALEDQDMYQYDGWFRPELRGLGLASQLGPAIVQLGAQEGKARMVSHVWPDNVRSLRMVYRNVGRAAGMDMALRLPKRVVHRQCRWKEPLVGWEKPRGILARARHLWFVRYALVRAGGA